VNAGQALKAVPLGTAAPLKGRSFPSTPTSHRVLVHNGTTADKSLSWCGIGPDYCTSPDCQINYGPACDGNKVPSGVSTARIARPKLGSVPYGGAGIYDCAVAGDIALTFDDGPYSYTGDLLDKLKVGFGGRISASGVTG